mmetsp:Transcript_16095/g.37930  ORF Transcript_16095/g.37930 Transcript_16095/m.37930 type:complete len:355 (+) Transcript_16095:114-1178(+)|eukprot:CAMPEP_0114557608 /NCGR_PEP_ID=MMETSP0114-20121206/9925_1 /TAXON_ID=31324 /ORGANISM="Goniomonas sp, Strain m" /LENGTH=354 /DNA_ID=CAMNT_0001742915 /DNA_START=98 /DNA_END=1162 /DNA_ORIENTATION=+
MSRKAKIPRTEESGFDLRAASDADDTSVLAVTVVAGSNDTGFSSSETRITTSSQLQCSSSELTELGRESQRRQADLKNQVSQQQRNIDAMSEQVLEYQTIPSDQPLPDEKFDWSRKRPLSECDRYQAVRVSYLCSRVECREPGLGVDFRPLFVDNREEEEREENDFWLTPRMAQHIRVACIVLSEMMRENPAVWAKSLPKCARALYRKNTQWRESFCEGFLRMAARLTKGMWPMPNCTAEEMGLHLAVEQAQATENEIGFDDIHGDCVQDYPVYDHDTNFVQFKSLAVDDEDVLYLFDDGRSGDGDESGDDDYQAATNSSAADWLGSGVFKRAAHLNPEDWFIASQTSRFHDHE